MLTQVTSGMLQTTAQYYGFKNRIINGGMVIDQRANGGSTSVQTSTTYATCDRWQTFASTNSAFSIQQNAGSVTPPANFTNYLGCTTASSSYSIGAGDYFGFRQGIEGYNIADWNWGTANAQSVTLSFWARSSLTGTFGGVVKNQASTRSYPFTYSISSANTWTYITVTIPGDTTTPASNWPTNNTNGVWIQWGLGVGSTYSGAAGSWSANNYISATGAISVVGTANAYLYVTGVQIEVGAQATSFDYRPYGTELQLCQRYYYQLPPWNSANLPICTTYQRSSTIAIGAMLFPVTMRGIPSINVNSGTAYFHVSVGAGDFDALTVGVEGGTYINKNGVSLTTTFASGSSTVGYAGELYLNAAGSILGFSAEL